MVLGEFITESTQYGKQEVTVKPKEGNYLRRTIKRSCPEYPWYDHGTGTFGYRAGRGCCLYSGRPGGKEF